MKKIFAAVLSMALVFGLVGCGSQQSVENTSGSQTVEGKTDEASVAKARELMEGLINAPMEDNVTEVVAVSTMTSVDEEQYRNTVTTTTMRDITGDTPRFYIKTESDPAAETDATYYVNGTEGVLEVGEEAVGLTYEQSYIDSLINPVDTSDQYRVYYDCTDQISYYEEDGVQVVMLQVDPAKLMENGLLSESFANIESCIAEYTFNPDGRLSAFISTIQGAMIGADGTDVNGTIETKCLFTDYGTTQVPELPEVPEGDAAEAEAAE